MMIGWMIGGMLMNSNSLLMRNEYESNRVAAKVMLTTIIFIVLVYILDVLNIFIVPIMTMTIAMAAAILMLVIPSIIVFVLKLDGWWVKYVIVSAAAIMVSFLSMFLSFHTVLMYIYAIAIASLYFSRRLRSLSKRR